MDSVSNSDSSNSSSSRRVEHGAPPHERTTNPRRDSSLFARKEDEDRTLDVSSSAPAAAPATVVATTDSTDLVVHQQQESPPDRMEMNYDTVGKKNPSSSSSDNAADDPRQEQEQQQLVVRAVDADQLLVAGESAAGGGGGVDGATGIDVATKCTAVVVEEEEVVAAHECGATTAAALLDHMESCVGCVEGVEVQHAFEEELNRHDLTIDLVGDHPNTSSSLTATEAALIRLQIMESRKEVEQSRSEEANALSSSCPCIESSLATPDRGGSDGGLAITSSLNNADAGGIDTILANICCSNDHHENHDNNDNNDSGAADRVHSRGEQQVAALPLLTAPSPTTVSSSSTAPVKKSPSGLPDDDANNTRAQEKEQRCDDDVVEESNSCCCDTTMDSSSGESSSTAMLQDISFLSSASNGGGRPTTEGTITSCGGEGIEIGGDELFPSPVGADAAAAAAAAALSTSSAVRGAQRSPAIVAAPSPHEESCVEDTARACDSRKKEESRRCAVCLEDELAVVGNGSSRLIQFARLPCCADSASSAPKICTTCALVLTIPASTGHDDDRGPSSSSSSTRRFGRCPLCRTWISVKTPKCPENVMDMELEVEKVANVAGECGVCYQIKDQLIVVSSSSSSCSAGGGHGCGGSGSSSTSAAAPTRNVCDACFLGQRQPLLYECDQCHVRQRIPHPMYRYQPKKSEFGTATWACQGPRCEKNKFSARWRILSDQVRHIPVGDTPVTWGDDYLEIARCRVREARMELVRGDENVNCHHNGCDIL